MPTNTTRSATYPLSLAIAQIPANANAQVTVKAWFRRSNTGLTGRLVCKANQLNGIMSDAISTMTAAIDTWEELTIQFTPTEAGVVEIEAQFWGGTTNSGWVSKLTVEQA